MIAEGDVWCWGDDRAGEAGAGSTDIVDPTATVLPSPARSVDVALGIACALTIDDRLFCAGDLTSFEAGSQTRFFEIALP